MMVSFYAMNLRRTLDKDDCAYIGENALSHLIEGFSCPSNPEVEHFLKHSSIEFTKKNQSITYLVFCNTAHKDILVGYYTLAIKPISVRASSISRTMERKLARVSTLNPDDGTYTAAAYLITYTAAAYLIAQIGKNFALPKSNRIKGVELLDLANRRIARTQYDFGGVVEFLECEDNPFLLDFYAENGFKAFDRRVTKSTDEEKPHELVQMLRFI